MPKIKSAKKRVRSSERRRVRNKSIRSLTKTSVIKAEKFIFSGEQESARESVAAAVSALDKAVGKGIIHANNAARRKSRLMNKLNKAEAAPLAEAETE
ncbi:MAG: 30S ribosomal protein S20 [Chloroflexi bacterium]|nr:30S ribosomal protein S20 [Chloroflexota bacterium]